MNVRTGSNPKGDKGFGLERERARRDTPGGLLEGRAAAVDRRVQGRQRGGGEAQGAQDLLGYRVEGTTMTKKQRESWRMVQKSRLRRPKSPSKTLREQLA